MQWTEVTMTSAQLAQGEEMNLVKAFTDQWKRLGTPREMAMFSLQDPDIEFDVFFFSPATA